MGEFYNKNPKAAAVALGIFEQLNKTYQTIPEYLKEADVTDDDIKKAMNLLTSKVNQKYISNYRIKSGVLEWTRVYSCLPSYFFLDSFGHLK